MLNLYLTLINTTDDKKKFENLYYEYRTLMKYIANGILKDEYLAEDAVHEAFLKLTRYLNKIDDIKCPRTKTFIVIIIRSVSLDILKKEKRIKTTDIEEISNIPAVTNDFLENIEVEELVSKIKSLPDTYRDILELKAYYNLSDKEIADILKISLSAARKRLQRARAALKEILKGGEENAVFK